MLMSDRMDDIKDNEQFDEEEECTVEEYTLTDEDGNESRYDLIGTLELNDKNYVALLPVEDTEGNEYVILRVEQDEDEEPVFVTIDDDDEFDSVADAFEDLFMGEFDCDENGFSVEE